MHQILPQFVPEEEAHASTPPSDLPDGVTNQQWYEQVQSEIEARETGRTRYLNNLQKKRERGAESETKHGTKIMDQALGLVVDGIEAWKTRLQTRGSCRYGIAYNYLVQIDPADAAFLALKTVLDSLTFMRPLLATALHIGSSIETELNWRKFKAEQPHLYPVIHADAMTRSYIDRRLTMMRARMASYEFHPEEWPHDHKLHTGMKLVDIIISTTDLIEVVNGEGRKKAQLHIRPTPKLLEWLRHSQSYWEILEPVYLPTLIPPKPWPGVEGGGYWSKGLHPLRLVKKRGANYLRSLAQTDISRVLQAVNTLQNTAWKVNTEVFKVANEAWDTGWAHSQLPQRFHEELPPKPLDISTNQESLLIWKAAAKGVYQRNAMRASRCIQTAKILWLGGKLQDRPRIYFPYQLDFRGRAYAVPMFLQPQGDDLARGLLHFADGKPLGDEMAAHWLAIHGANTYGYDKVSLADRVAWVHDHERQIIEAAKNPFDNTWWTEADGGEKAWQFLAFCFEWLGYLQRGLSHVTHIPIALDGSCNGLQHFSAMMRDPVGGQATNLMPAEEPQDIYAEVAKVALKAIEADSQSPYSARWVAAGISRKITKRPVMVLPYGGTRYSCMDYVEQACKEKFDKEPNPFSKDEFPLACRYLAKHVWESIAKVVVKATETMGWLRKVASAYNKANLPIVWKAPSGFTVFQEYRKGTASRVEIEFLGRSVRFQREVGAPDLDTKRQMDGISPNFVHSMDAAALMLCVLDSSAQGITNFAMIHDSYGTLAPDTSALGASLRDVFVRMYEEFNPIEDMVGVCKAQTGVELPAPAPGDLDLGAIRDSPFFFA